MIFFRKSSFSVLILILMLGLCACGAKEQVTSKKDSSQPAKVNLKTTPSSQKQENDNLETDQTGTYNGTTGVIHMISPKPNLAIKPGMTITISGNVIKEEKNQQLQVILFSGTERVSQVLQSQEYKVGSDGSFNGTFSIPNHLPPSGTEMQLSVELLVKGGPRVWTNMKAQ